jgi:hypothetical protein
VPIFLVTLLLKLNDRTGNQRGGREWMGADKNSLEGNDNSNKMNLVGYPKSHAPHTTFHLPKPCSHWSATGPRNKHYLQPQFLHTHTAVKTTRKLPNQQGRFNRGKGAVKSPAPRQVRNPPKHLLWDPKLSTVHPLDPLVKAKLATRES